MIDEHLLIDRAQRGDMEAFRELVERSKVKIYRLAYDLTGNRHDAEDLSQDVFLKAYRSLGSFRREAKWSTWIYRITMNTCLDQRKLKSRGAIEYREDVESNLQNGAAPSSHRPDKVAEGSMMQKDIEKALDALTPQERSVFVLRHYHDLPLKDIAHTLEIAEGTVKSYLFRALQRLQRELAFYRKDLGLEKRQ